jgi:uncharacterized protein
MSFQPLPAVTDDTAPFWESGAVGELRIMRCHSCSTWFHPPAPVCPECLSTDVAAEIASGKAAVVTYTVNVQPWAPDMEVPYVIAIVELAEQSDVRLTTRLVDCGPTDVSIGMAVEVVFHDAGNDVWLPLFRPVASVAGGGGR